MHAAHLSEWQRRSFDISSGTCSPEQKAEAYRAHILSIQYAWASATLSQPAAAGLLGTLTERYAAILDSDNPRAGLNNYAESALHLARSQRNESDRWESSLTAGVALGLPCMRRALTGRAQDSAGAPADAQVVVGGDISQGPAEGFGAAVGGLVRDAAETTDEAATAFPLSSSREPPRATSLFGHSAPPFAGPPHQANGGCHQPAFFSSSSNASKRKAFYGQDEEVRGPEQESHRGPDARGRRGEDSRATAFRSAREQLSVGQQKKQGAQPQRGLPSGGLKKSLGASRSRGAFSRFVSPLPKQEEGDSGGAGSGTGQELQLVDERLKNMEPKIIELIMSEIMDHGPPVAWDDIAGLDFAKATIKEIVVWPMLRPDIFTGLRGPPKGILLFGPPGTGKTLIGKCIACQSGATFFSISASSLTSKWVGEGEKMVRALFAIARCHQPAVIFIDEIDSLLSQRTDGEHDSSRRIKTEFLVQLDGAATSADDRILVVGATNRPQEIDEAARRRLAKRLYIPLPGAAARRQIVARLTARERCQLGPDELEQVVARSEGFSGADMTQLCREAALGPIRSIQIADIATISPEQVRPMLYSDFQEALKTVRPSVSPKDLELYKEWNQTFGCGR
ncbi:fidgetin-like protein 1 [Anguilla rostrata]|uniref:fidgetin-like protein 1 n=1 Tax=Anguilla rostrata TaxID=7938 RepID=UPI0030CFD15E